MKRYKILARSIICFVLIFILQTSALALNYSEITTFSEAYIPSEPSTVYNFLPEETINMEPMDREINDTVNRKELKSLIKEYQEIVNSAHDLAEATRALGYNENHPIIEFAKKEYETANEYLEIYQNRLDKINSQWNNKLSTYPVATEIWLYMKDQGWNDAVCAGILGNIMAECGGHTLSLQPTASNKYYYGICQWSKGYSSVWYSDLDTQCEFLINTIGYEFNTFGSSYKRGFNFNSFLNLNDEKEVAKAFAKCYERCGSSSLNQRQKNATTAYNYFTN